MTWGLGQTSASTTMGVTLKIEALVFNLCQKLVKENFIECDYQNRIVKIEVNVQFNVLNKEFCSRLDRILLAFMLQLVESKICDSEAEPPTGADYLHLCRYLHFSRFTLQT